MKILKGVLGSIMVSNYIDTNRLANIFTEDVDYRVPENPSDCIFFRRFYKKDNYYIYKEIINDIQMTAIFEKKKNGWNVSITFSDLYMEERTEEIKKLEEKITIEWVIDRIENLIKIKGED